LRDQVCTILIELWSKLDDRKLHVAKELVLPLLRLTDSGHSGSREFGSTTYFDILRTEYQKTSALFAVENYTIDAVVNIVAERNHAVAKSTSGNSTHGTSSSSSSAPSTTSTTSTTSSTSEKLQKNNTRSPGEGFLELFTSQLENQFLDDDVFKSDLAIRFLEGIKKLFVLLSALSKYESSPDSSVYEDERAASMLSLMDYLRVTNRTDMRIKYIKKLTSLHKSLGSHVEAGNVILMTLDTGSDSTETKNASPNTQNKMDRVEIQLTEAAVASFKHGDDWQR
jgi:hypothetical protein